MLGASVAKGTGNVGTQDRIDTGEDQVVPASITPEARDQLKLWLRDTMKRKNWSAEGWAKIANLSGTTITRFLNSEDPQRILTARTVEKLARAAGAPNPQEQRKVFIALIRRDQLLEEARRIFPRHLDFFSMPSLEYIPAPPQFEDCKLAELDNGKFALCKQAELTAMRPGNRLVVLRECITERASTAIYFWDPPMLVPVETTLPNGAWVSSLPLGGPDHQILGRAVGHFTLYPDD
jgi:transcriptional regulator with XRE-family HTH domain